MDDEVRYILGIVDEEEDIRACEGVGNPTGEERKGRRNPHKYTASEDIAILREVIQEQPFIKRSSKNWNVIHERCNISVKDGIAIQRRFLLLVDQFKKNDVKSLKGSGLEEDYDEKRQLLQTIIDLMNDVKMTSEVEDESQRKKTEDEASQAQTIRKASMESLKPDGDTPEHDDYEIKKKRLRKDEYLSMLEKSDEREHESKTLALKLEERRLELQEREISIREVNEAHRREKENRQLDLEEKRLELEARKAESDQKEKQLLFQLLSAQLKLPDVDKKDSE